MAGIFDLYNAYMQQAQRQGPIDPMVGQTNPSPNPFMAAINNWMKQAQQGLNAFSSTEGTLLNTLNPAIPGFGADPHHAAAFNPDAPAGPPDPSQGDYSPDDAAIQHLMEAQHTGVVDASALGLPPGQLTQMFDKINGLLQDQTNYADQQYQQHQQMSNQLLGQLQQQMATPAPQNDPQAEFYTRLAGNISQALAPQMGGQQQAEGTLTNRLSDIRTQRSQQTQLLAKRYQDEADRADKFGDLAAGLKYREKANNMLKQAELMVQEHTARGMLSLRSAVQGNKASDAAFKQMDDITGILGDRTKAIQQELRDHRSKVKDKNFKGDQFTQLKEDNLQDWQLARTTFQGELVAQQANGDAANPQRAQLKAAQAVILKDMSQIAQQGAKAPDFQTLAQRLHANWSDEPFSELGVDEESVKALYYQLYQQHKLPMQPPPAKPGLFQFNRK